MSIACSTSIACGSSLDVALQRIAGLGFRNVDILTIDGWVHVNTRDLADNFDSTIANVDGLLQQHNLKPIATNSGVSAQLHHRGREVNAQRLHEIDGLLRFAQHLGISVAAIQPRNADNERLWDDVLADSIMTLLEQKAAGDAVGVTFALELHVHSPFETLEQARRFCEAMPEMALVYDPTHFVMQGVDIRETGWLMDRASHVHLRDAASGKIQAPFGKGDVDFDWVFGALKDRGYQGHFSIEYLESEDFDVLQEVPKLRDAIAQHFEA
ncbi:MAG TPA: sugar phosphate isomerase/epimerase [Abditibacteriaceae bacterium]|jgi:sugar phosphate isomerase/epimerase